ncbi:hypothetical protein Plec18167_004337 [Paecilomyces lecythidis]|uniref:Alpha/beta hydrolase fold-3 domain-containing protein n=1 Tax=Paecilomyces lecythidis TaxID=3004212 RepID=A0ABR3XSS0_9EURO
MGEASELGREKIANFHLIQQDYKHFGGHGIRADILIPKAPFQGKRPVIARFHGGGLIAGDSLYLDWIPPWLLQLAERHSAVIISPNYRLMPEATGLDILEDVEEFWSWLHSSSLAKTLKNHESETTLDLSRIITAGDSAGGLLSIYLALSHPDEIRAGTAAYPMVDMHEPDYCTPQYKQMFDSPVLPASVVTDHLAKMKPEDAALTYPPPERFPLFLAAFQHGKVLEFYERGAENSPRKDDLFLIERLEKEGAKLPRGGIVILHGSEDSVVPVRGSEKFIAKAKEVMKGKQGGDKLVLSLRPGYHGFDGDTTLDAEWLKEALESAVEAWLE